jgi:Tfp pilus assembly protein PilO
MQATLSGLIPTTPDFYDYITLMSNTTAAAGVHLVSITPSTSGTPITGTDLEAIPVILSTSGTYDSTLGLIKAIYALPRLTTINSMAITGGGPGTNRSTLLDETFSLTIYSSARPTNPNAG